MKRFTLLLAIAIMSCSAALAQNVSEKMNFTNFTSIDAEYAYQINVTKGSSNTIEVIYPERLKEHLKIFISGETLNLSTNFPKKNYVLFVPKCRLFSRIHILHFLLEIL